MTVDDLLPDDEPPEDVVAALHIRTTAITLQMQHRNADDTCPDCGTPWPCDVAGTLINMVEVLTPATIAAYREAEVSAAKADRDNERSKVVHLRAELESVRRHITDDYLLEDIDDALHDARDEPWETQ